MVSGWQSRLAFVALGLTLPLRKRRVRTGQLGVWRSSACWVVAAGVTFVVLGLAPAKILSPGAQRVVTRALALNLPWLIAVGALAWLLRRRGWRFSLFEFLFLVPVIGGLLCFWLTLAIADTFESPFGWQASAVGPQDWPPLLAPEGMTTPPETGWAIQYEWFGHGGVWATALLALGLLAGWSWRRLGPAATVIEQLGKHVRSRC